MPTRDFIAEVLANRQFSALIDRREDLWFEAKRNHKFDPANALDRIELSKDVSALANGEGGFLLIGLRTERVPDELTDRVTELDLFPEAEFDAGGISGVIRRQIFPKIKDVQVKWIENAATPSLGLGCVNVPRQSADDQPFLMKEIVEGDAKIKQIVFGIARRDGTSNLPWTIEQLHRAILHGKTSTSERLTRIEGVLSRVLARLYAVPQKPAKVPADVLLERTRRVFGDE